MINIHCMDKEGLVGATPVAEYDEYSDKLVEGWRKIIKAEQLHLEIARPLPTTRSFQNIGGFTRQEVYRCICEAYAGIAEEMNEEQEYLLDGIIGKRGRGNKGVYLVLVH